MKRIAKPVKYQRQKASHLIALLDKIGPLGMNTIVNGWPIHLHGVIYKWCFNYNGKVYEALPCQIKVLKKITTKRTKNANKDQAGSRAMALAAASRGLPIPH